MKILNVGVRTTCSLLDVTNNPKRLIKGEAVGCGEEIFRGLFDFCMLPDRFCILIQVFELSDAGIHQRFDAFAGGNIGRGGNSRAGHECRCGSNNRLHSLALIGRSLFARHDDAACE